jgi:glycerol-3-phosphate dehydrogenase (NAD(P)+)
MQDLVKRFNRQALRVYMSKDIIGVQLGGAVKNVIAIAVGASDGLHYGANARSALITRGLAEIMRLGLAMGAQPQTFMGLSGMGDLVLTCTDDQSRNRRLGLAIAQGKSVEIAMKEIGQVVEGINTVEQVIYLANKYQVEMPICQQVSRVLNGKVQLRDAVTELLSRGPKFE